MLTSQDFTYSRGYLGISSILGAFLSILACSMTSVRRIAEVLHNRSAFIRCACRVSKAFVRKVCGIFTPIFLMLGRCFRTTCASSSSAPSRLRSTHLIRADRRQIRCEKSTEISTDMMLKVHTNFKNDPLTSGSRICSEDTDLFGLLHVGRSLTI